MTQVSQPLDVGPFSALEKKIQLLSHHWHGNPANAGKKLDQYSMMKLVVYEAVQQVFSRRETVISGFRRTGLVPWRKLNPEHLKKLSPGTVFKCHHHAEVFPDPGPTVDLSPDLNNLTTVSEAAPTLQIEHFVSDPEPVDSAAVTATETVLDMETVPVPDSDNPAPSSSASAPSSSAPCSSTSSISATEMAREASSSTMSREASASSTATLPSSSDPAFDSLVAEQRELTQEHKVWLLQRHELLLGPPRVKLFEDLYAKNLLHCPNTEFQCWLLLKQQAVGTEAEALERVLSSRKPKEVPKKKTTRKMDLPEGADRYDLLSQGWKECFARTEARKNKRKISSPDSPPALTPAPPAKVRKVKKTK